MQVLSSRVVAALNNLPGFPAAPATTTGTPQEGQFILGTYLDEVKVRPGVLNLAALPLVGNTLGDVRIVVDEQAWYLWDGGAWVQITGGGGGGSVNPSITGQITAGLSVGEVCYTSDANTWAAAQADGTLTQATAIGVFQGTAGTISLSGSTISAVRCTTDGGAPAVNAKLYLAPAAADGGTGAGKVTATPPGGSVHLQVVGTCVDASAYGGSKEVKMILQPTYPIILVG